MHFDLGHFAHARHVVIIEVGLLHAAVIDGDGVLHDRGQGVNGRALRLRDNSAGIDRATEVDGVHQAVHAHLPLRDADFRDRGGVRLERVVSRDAARDALRQRLARRGGLAPLRFLRGQLQNALEPRGIQRLVFLRIGKVGNLARVADQLQPELQWVNAGRSRQLVDKRLDHEAAAGMLHRAPPRARNAAVRPSVLNAEIRRLVRPASRCPQLPCCGDSPETLAINCCAHCGACVGTRASAPSGWMCTVQFIGSMQACAAKGSSYTASTFFAPEPSALSASPSLRTTLPGCAAFSTKCLRSDSLDSPAFGPSSQVMSSALRPCTAAHELSASTTTPPAVNAPSPTGSMGNTSRTPGTCFALAASNFASLPPKTGQRAITAYSMPGMRESIPNFAPPVDLAAASKRLRSWPIIVKSSGFFSGTVLRSGTGSLAASPTSSP